MYDEFTAMIYLFISNNSIELVSLSKTLLGQYNLSTFEKTHTVDLLTNGQVGSVDVLASAIKEAITGATPAEVKDHEVYLILPQELFAFARYSVPADIQENAIVPFIKDKARSSLPFDLDSSHYNYMVLRMQNESAVQFFAVQKEAFAKFQEVFSLLGLTIKSVVPETVGYFKLFEKTLKKDKKERIIYASYDEKQSFAFHYDSLGLLEATRMDLNTNIEETLKKKADELKEKVQKVDRLVLSGEKSKTVRQDLFTKKVGIWTNPLEKIVVNFYQDYLKLLVSPGKGELPFLKFDAPLGGFILATENPQFSILGESNFKPMKMGNNGSGKRFSLPSLSVKTRDMFMFITSFLLSFVLIYFGPKVYQALSNRGDDSKPIVLAPTETPKKDAEPTTAPTPAFKKEDVRIKILNGSGTVGKASEVKDILKKAGYVDILTGNADKFDYETTEVQVKKSVTGLFEQLTKDVAENVKLTKSTVLDEDDAADAIIIIGTDFE